MPARVLKRFPHNKLIYRAPVNSGFFYRGEGRDLISTKNATYKELIILDRNNDSLLIFENNTN